MDDFKENLEKRVNLLRKCANNELIQQKVKELCKRDTVYFFENFLFTYDPRTEKKNLPFILYPFQKKFLAELDYCYLNKLPLLVEKSRDMGFSWLYLGWSLHKMLFNKSFSVGVGSQKMEKVDKLGDMNSLMEKIRYMLRKMPEWLRGGYDERKNSKEGLILIPETESIMKGEAGDNIGRGGRTSTYMIDEFAHLARSTVVQESVSQTSDFITYGSTPKGKGNEFARLRWKTKIRRFTMHWKDHPKKTQEWYDKLVASGQLTEAMIAQEIDISYNKSVEGKVYKWFDANIHAKENYQYNANYPLYLTFDWGIGDPTSCIFLQVISGIIYIIDHFEVKDMDIEEIILKVQSRLSQWTDYHNNIVTLNHVSGWYGDPDGNNRDITSGESIASYIKDKYKISLRFKYPNIPKVRILSVNMLGRHGRIRVNKNLHYLIECFENYRYPDKQHGENEKPLHDWACHTPSALEYFCVYEYGMDQYDYYSTEITTTGFR